MSSHRSNTKDQDNKIVGTAPKSKFAPFQVGLLFYKQFDPKTKTQSGAGECGGTIISKQHVLTAAHCVTQLKNPNQILREFVAIDPKKGGAVFVVFGLLNWCPAKNKLDENWDGPWENIIPAEEITFHPSWNFDKSGEDFDIAIIKVSKCLIALEGYTCHAPPPSP